jgi:hypothetical protein
MVNPDNHQQIHRPRTKLLLRTSCVQRDYFSSLPSGHRSDVLCYKRKHGFQLRESRGIGIPGPLQCPRLVFAARFVQSLHRSWDASAREIIDNGLWKKALGIICGN